MADDTNEDSWLYGTSNPDSTTNEDRNVDETIVESAKEPPALSVNIKPEGENEAQASSVDNESDKMEQDKPPDVAEVEESYGEFEDPAQEMEEDEEAAAAATAADTTDKPEDETPNEQVKSDDDVDDEDDSDDDINVVIGDIKAAPSTYNIKQRGNLIPGPGQDKTKSAGQGGKFSMEDFEGVGTINGVPTHEFSIDSLEEKPWRKPGADITDYFNYGFNEETWRAYCERQKRFRVMESGVGLASLTQNINQTGERHHDNLQVPPLVPGVINQNMNGGPQSSGLSSDSIPISAPSGMPGQSGHHGQPPRIPMMPRGPRPILASSTKENAIQVMTAECREYSRPGVVGQMPPNFGPPNPEEQFFPEADPYDYGYEPTQESQWNNDNPGWMPTGIKELTPGPGMVPPPQMGGGPNMPPMQIPQQMGVPPPQMGNLPPQQMGGPPMRPHPSLMPGMPPNMGMGPPPGMGMGMMMGPGGPPMRMGPPRMMVPPMGGPGGPNAGNPPPLMDRERHERERHERERERERELERERVRERERERDRERERERDRERERERDRERRDDREGEGKYSPVRSTSRGQTRSGPTSSGRSERDRDRRDRDRDRDYERERSERRDRDRERDSERDRERDGERTEKKDEVKKEKEENTDEDRERRRRERERERERDRDRSRRERSRSREKSRRRSPRRSKSREKDRERSSKSTAQSSNSSRR